MPSTPSPLLERVKSIAVIGAGPSGLVAAKYLLAENAFDKIVIFEQRDNVGGVWNATPNLSSQFSTSGESITFPQTLPTFTPVEPVICDPDNGGDGGKERKMGFISPIYDSLETNIPKQLMAFHGAEFDDEEPLFPSHTGVLRYLEQYAEDVRQLVQFRTQVLDVRLMEGESGTIWSVKIRRLDEGIDGKSSSGGNETERSAKGGRGGNSGKEDTEVFDAVIVASGHYDTPFVPDIAGLKSFHEKWPNVVSHSKYYRRPEQYKAKKVIVVGALASGIDISSQISSVCSSPLLLSVKVAPDNLNPNPKIRYVLQIIEFLPAIRGVRLVDNHIESDIDAIIFCTGYLYSFPFLSHLDPPVITDGQRARELWHQLFYRPIPTLAFLALPQRIVPFPFSEAQSFLVARVFSTAHFEVPRSAEEDLDERARVERRGGGKAFHVMEPGEDVEYMCEMLEMARHVGDPEERQMKSKEEPGWNGEKVWMRKLVPEIKKKALELGAEKRKEIKTVEQLGFDYAKWKDDYDKQEDRKRVQERKRLDAMDDRELEVEIP